MWAKYSGARVWGETCDTSHGYIPHITMTSLTRSRPIMRSLLLHPLLIILATLSSADTKYGDYPSSQLYSSTLWMSQDFNQIWGDYTEHWVFPIQTRRPATVRSVGLNQFMLLELQSSSRPCHREWMCCPCSEDCQRSDIHKELTAEAWPSYQSWRRILYWETQLRRHRDTLWWESWRRQSNKWW